MDGWAGSVAVDDGVAGADELRGEVGLDDGTAVVVPVGADVDAADLDVGGLDRTTAGALDGALDVG